MAHPADKPAEIRQKPRHCVYDGPARAIPPAQRARSKGFGHLDDPVVPRSYWYWMAGLVAAALVLGILLGCWLLA